MQYSCFISVVVKVAGFCESLEANCNLFPEEVTRKFYPKQRYPLKRPHGALTNENALHANLVNSLEH